MTVPPFLHHGDQPDAPSRPSAEAKPPQLKPVKMHSPWTWKQIIGVAAVSFAAGWAMPDWHAPKGSSLNPPEPQVRVFGSDLPKEYKVPGNWQGRGFYIRDVDTPVVDRGLRIQMLGGSVDLGNFDKPEKADYIYTYDLVNVGASPITLGAGTVSFLFPNSTNTVEGTISMLVPNGGSTDNIVLGPGEGRRLEVRVPLLQDGRKGDMPRAAYFTIFRTGEPSLVSFFATQRLTPGYISPPSFKTGERAK